VAADHQRVGERPRLARDISDLAHVDPRFFLELARDRGLNALAELDEAREFFGM